MAKRVIMPRAFLARNEIVELAVPNFLKHRGHDAPDKVFARPP